MQRRTLSESENFKERLKDEVDLVWVIPKKIVMIFKWVREYDARKYLVKPKMSSLSRFNVIAYTIDNEGKMVRVFRNRKEDIKNYDGLWYGPMEAVKPNSIAVGISTIRPD